MTKILIAPKVYTIEFTTFVVYANSKKEAGDIIKKYILKQSKNFDKFFDQRAIITEKEIFASINK